MKLEMKIKEPIASFGEKMMLKKYLLIGKYYANIEKEVIIRLGWNLG